MSAPALASITFDCADAHALATFWAAVLGRTVSDGATASYASVDSSPPLTFIAVPESKSAKNRVHLDLSVGDLEVEATRLVDLGATRLGEFTEDGYSWLTLADPEGNELDIVVGP